MSMFAGHCSSTEQSPRNASTSIFVSCLDLRHLLHRLHRNRTALVVEIISSSEPFKLRFPKRPSLHGPRSSSPSSLRLNICFEIFDLIPETVAVDCPASNDEPRRSGGEQNLPLVGLCVGMELLIVVLLDSYLELIGCVSRQTANKFASLEQHRCEPRAI